MSGFKEVIGTPTTLAAPFPGGLLLQTFVINENGVYADFKLTQIPCPEADAIEWINKNCKKG